MHLDADGLRAALKTLNAPYVEKPAITSIAQATREAMAKNSQTLARLTACIGELGLEIAEDHSLHVALKILDRLKPGPNRALPPGTANPFGRAWVVLINGPDCGLALCAWWAATLLLLKRSLRNGSTAIEASHSWRSPDNHLIPRRLWDRDQGRFLSDFGVDKAAGAYLRVLEPALETALQDLAAAVETGAIAIADGRLRIPRPERATEDPGIPATRDALLARIGPVQLPDVIMDVDRATGLSRILLGRDACSEREQLQLYGAILALGSDLDATQAARMIAGASAEGIGVMVRSLEHGDLIHAANAALVDKIGSLEVARFWGAGIH
ncbi:MAG: Tn3 family transposase [Pseudomonadota bacterium]